MTGRTFEDSVAENGLDDVQADGTGLGQTELWAHRQSLSWLVIATVRPGTHKQTFTSEQPLMWREAKAACKRNPKCSHDSREESGKLRNELHFPAAGEVDHLPAAFDVAADTRPLHLAPTARLEESFTTSERPKRQQRAAEREDA